MSRGEISERYAGPVRVHYSSPLEKLKGTTEEQISKILMDGLSVSVEPIEDGVRFTRVISEKCVKQLLALIQDATKEICICAAVRSNGNIIRGHRHNDCLRTANNGPGVTDPGWVNGDDQGFVTSKNRYVTRQEGLVLQKAAGIKSHNPAGYRGKVLFSEDLY